MTKRWRLLAAALFLIGAPTAALAARGTTTSDVNMRAGPGTDYPLVATVPEDARVNIHGCLSDYDWCDVSWSGERGWINAQYLDYYYNNRYVYLPDYVDVIDVPVVTFTLGSYWADYYPHRPWYRRLNHWVNVWRSHGSYGQFANRRGRYERQQVGRVGHERFGREHLGRERERLGREQFGRENHGGRRDEFAREREAGHHMHEHAGAGRAGFGRDGFEHRSNAVAGQGERHFRNAGRGRAQFAHEPNALAGRDGPRMGNPGGGRPQFAQHANGGATAHFSHGGPPVTTGAGAAAHIGGGGHAAAPQAAPHIGGGGGGGHGGGGPGGGHGGGGGPGHHH
jgi:uncharacterized protein YraI